MIKLTKLKYATTTITAPLDQTKEQQFARKMEKLLLQFGVLCEVEVSEDVE